MNARPRFLAAVVVAGLALSLLPSVAATAQSPLPDEVVLEGTLRVVPDESGMGTSAGTTASVGTVTLVTAAGTAVQLAGDELGGAVSGARFAGTVAVAPELAELVEEVPATEAPESVARAASASDSPLEVTDATITAPTARSAAAKAHTVDIMYVTTTDAPRPLAADIDDAIDRLSEYWTSQSDGQISSMSRSGAIRYAARPARELCDPELLWEYAAGPKGFGRAGSTTEWASGYYWAEERAAHLVVVVPDTVCAEGVGLGTVGTIHSGGVTWASVDAADPSSWDHVLAHEIGHNLGLGHSNLAQCGTFYTDGPSCTSTEYFDFYDVMGGGIRYGSMTNDRDLAALNVTHKATLEALPRGGADPALREVTGRVGDAQRFTLQAASADEGLRGLEIVHPRTGEKYYVEYRSGTGRDADAFYRRFADRYPGNGYGTGVRVLKAGCLGSNDCGAVESYIQPTTKGSLVLASGQAFTSYVRSGSTAPGVRITVISTSETAAVVRVSFADITTRPQTLTSPRPTVSGTPKVGLPLRVKTGTWTADTKLAYQWLVGGKAVGGATKTSFTPTPTHAGKTVTVTVTGTKTGYTTASKTSAATGKVAKATVIRPAAPKVTGTAKVGSRLRATPVTKLSGATLTYRWFSNGAPIKGATKTSFVVRRADKGKRIVVRITYAKPGYVTASATSSKVVIR